MRAFSYTSSDHQRWDEFVRSTRVAHFMHERDYMDYHADRFVDASMLVEDERGKLVAVLPASRHGDQLRTHGGLTFGGIQVTSRLGAAKMLAVLGAIIRHGRETGANSMRYKPAPHIYQAAPADEDLYALYRAGAVLARRDLSAAIYLDDRVRYNRDRRQALKRVPPELVVEASSDYDTFVGMLNDALRRHDAVATHTAAELTLLAERFPQAIKLHLATLDGQPVAGVVTYDTTTTRHTQYIATTEAGRRAYAGVRIVDQLIEAAVGRFRWFDFGISTERDGHYLNPGLASNKELYGGRGVNYDHYDLAFDDAAVQGLEGTE